MAQVVDTVGAEHPSGVSPGSWEIWEWNTENKCEQIRQDCNVWGKAGGTRKDEHPTRKDGRDGGS